jgi:D-glycerate 3-kinase
VTLSWQNQIYETADRRLWQELRLKLEAIPDPVLRQPRLIEDLYLPLYFFLTRQTEKHAGRPHFIGINAPQGGGKSTLAGYLVKLFAWCGYRAVTLSIDDFYLTHVDQTRLARMYPDNPYLQQRGYPGTHDIALGLETLTCLKEPKGRAKSRLPRYDKSLHQGRGDRMQMELWPEVALPVDVVVLEGWMLGFQPLPPDRIQTRALAEVNALLANYRAWHRFLNTFVYLRALDPVYAIEWRSEAESRMKARGLPGMSNEEVRAYAEKFLPAYQLYGPPLAQRPPAADYLSIDIGRDRLPAVCRD